MLRASIITERMKRVYGSRFGIYVPSCGKRDPACRKLFLKDLSAGLLIFYHIDGHKKWERGCDIPVEKRGPSCGYIRLGLKPKRQWDRFVSVESPNSRGGKSAPVTSTSFCQELCCESIRGSDPASNLQRNTRAGKWSMMIELHVTQICRRISILSRSLLYKVGCLKIYAFSFYMEREREPVLRNHVRVREIKLLPLSRVLYCSFLLCAQYIAWIGVPERESVTK